MMMHSRYKRRNGAQHQAHMCGQALHLEVCATVYGMKGTWSNSEEERRVEGSQTFLDEKRDCKERDEKNEASTNR